MMNKIYLVLTMDQAVSTCLHIRPTSIPDEIYTTIITVHLQMRKLRFKKTRELFQLG